MWEEYLEKIHKNKGVDSNWYIVGIDLGTTNSVISYIHTNTSMPEPLDISNGFGKIPMPSVVQYRKYDNEDEWIVGEEAYRSMKIYPNDTVLSIKRKMGSNEKVILGNKSYLPEEISAKILKQLISQLETMNPKMALAGVVVSVPYDFDDAAKKATIRACHIAGISDALVCLIEEPKAAALSYNFSHELYHEEKIMVFDFGGGTLDITIFQVDKKVDELILKVLSEGGQASHGGDNIDEILMKEMMKYLKEKTNITKENISQEHYTEVLLRARETKERLSGVKKFRIPFTFCIPPFMKEITRDEFETLISGFIHKTRRLVLKTLEESYDGALKPDDINRILLEGGSSAMPWIRKMLVSIFNDEEKIYLSDKPALDISIGATYYAAMKMGVLEHTDIILTRNNINFEVSIPHDIGFEVNIGNKKVFHKMISRGTPYPLALKSQVFTLSGNSEKDMTSLQIKILERINKGDDIHKCRIIGEVKIIGLPKRPTGKTRLKVTLVVEEDKGIVKGKVEDLGYKDEYVSSGFIADFIPDRNIETVVAVNKMVKEI